MDLFPVQRYLGDEEDSSKNDGTEVENNMCKLLSKIDERARIRNIKSKKVCNGVKVNLQTSTPTPTLSKLENSKPGRIKKRHKKEHLNEEKGSTITEEFTDGSKDAIPSRLLNDMNKLNVNDSRQSDEEDNETREMSGENVEEAESKEIFPVIGDYKFKKKNKVKRVLPDWLANPSVVSVDLKKLDVAVDDIPDLHPIFVNNLKSNKISHFFPVQAQVIPWLLSSTKRLSVFWPCDICVSAPTGSGKTLAYVLPILQALMNRRIGQIQAVVVLPVQDLASQVASVFRTYSVGTGLKVHLSTGGLPLQEDRAHLLRQKLGVGWVSLVDILVITPGRLVEHLYSTPGFSLKQLQYIVIDEADRIVDNMQNNWLHHLDQHLSVQGCPLLTLHNLKMLPRRPQKLLFSATLSMDPEKLEQLHLFQPRLFTSVVEATKDQGSEGEFIGKFTTPAELQEHMVQCTLAVKPLVLYQLISRDSWSRVLVFTSSGRSVHHLCALLRLLSQKTERSINVEEISAECSPKKREAILVAFAAGKVDVLVSTDSLARGMDIADVRYVISYDMPKYVKAYIHRVGRTGRAGQQGIAVTIVTHTQVGLFRQMLQTAGKQDTVTELTVSEDELKLLESPFREALRELRSVTEGEETRKLLETKSLKRVTSTKIKTKKRKKRKNDGGIMKKLKKDELS